MKLVPLAIALLSPIVAAAQHSGRLYVKGLFNGG
jgi:hypothetical protein